MQTSRRVIHAIGLAVAGLVAGAGVARAQVTEADVGVNKTFEQTLGGVDSTGGFFSGRAFVNSASDFAGGTLTYGGSGSPQTLSYVPADGAWEYAIGHASFSDLQTAFPTGGYRFDLTGGAMGPATVALNYDGDAYSNVPEFSAASFAALQALNSDDPITLDFNAMDVSPNATPGANTIVFSITDSSNATVFNEAFSPTDTSVTLPAFLLSPRQSYSFDLLFDDRITANDGGILLTQFYDTHTDGSIFTTAAIPEPSTWAMLLIGFAGLGFGGYRKARKRAAIA